MTDGTERLLLTPDGGPRDRIVGFETEYGLSTRDRSGKYNELDTIILASRGMRQFGSAKNGLMQYKDTGERIYLDVGDHPEYSTAEEISFTDAADRVTEGHLKMARVYAMAAVLLSADKSIHTEIGSVDLIANTCSPDGQSWASHESYLTRRRLSPTEYTTALAVHHLSRIVWSGAGKVSKNPHHYRFELSEKAEHIFELTSLTTTRNRALVNERDEALADAEIYRRIHVITGESVFSPFVNALRLASGSIVLRACEIGVNFEDLKPVWPTRAMREISADPTLKATVEMEDGRHLTGIDLQRAIAERSIAATMERDYLTAQEQEWGQKWLEILDDLERDPLGCAKKLDWVVKQKRIESALQAQGGSSRESDIAIAWKAVLDYHRLLPAEGDGMQLLRKGFYDGSPDFDVLENGLALPPTRGGLRGNTLFRLHSLGLDPSADWKGIKAGSRDSLMYRVVLNDPYQTDSERIERLLQMVG